MQVCIPPSYILPKLNLEWYCSSGEVIEEWMTEAESGQVVTDKNVR